MMMETQNITSSCRPQVLKFTVAVFCCCYLFYALDVWASAKLAESVVIMDRINKTSPGKSCERILSDAHLSGHENPWFVTRGCKLHNYTHSEAQTCMHKIAKRYGVNSIAMVGDSRMRNLFVGLTKFLGKPKWEITIPMRHADFHYYNPDIDTLVFLRFRGKVDKEILDDYVTWEESPTILRPRVVIQGNALWDLVYGGPFIESSKHFEGNLSKIIPHMEKVSKTTDILWMVQDPTDKRKMDAANIDIRGPKRIDAYNKMAIKLLSPTPVKIWHSARKVAVRFPNDSDAGGIHFGPRVIEYKVQLFLNWYCNRHMTFSDGTCCKTPDVVRPLYVTTPHPFFPTATITFLLSCIIVTVLIRILCPRAKQTTIIGKSCPYKDDNGTTVCIEE